jgi:hypothetical protein
MNNLLQHSQLFLKRNAATILTSIGGVGVVVTSVMAVKATPKALASIEKAKEEKGEELTKMETVKVAGPAYIPAILFGASTIACIFGANALNKRQQAALISAYALLENSYKDHKAKVEELYGKDADREIKEEIAKDKYEETDIQVDDGTEMFYDNFSGQYFTSTTEKVQRAEYQINRDLSMRDWATVNEFYEYLGIPTIPGGDELGWSTCMNFDYYWQSWIDFGHSKMTMEDGKECHVITMFEEPTLDWANY